VTKPKGRSRKGVKVLYKGGVKVLYKGKHITFSAEGFQTFGGG
jgi:hypothetical protein